MSHYFDIREEDFIHRVQSEKVTSWTLIREIGDDRISPIAILEQLSQEEKYTFLLESAENHCDYGNISYIGLKIKETLRYEQGILFKNDQVEQKGQDPIQMVREYCRKKSSNPYCNRKLPFSGGLVGVVGYETIQYIESQSLSLDLKAKQPPLFWMVPEEILMVDHFCHKVYILKVCWIPQERSEEELRATFRSSISEVQATEERLKAYKIQIEGQQPIDSNARIEYTVTQEEFEDKVKKIKQYIYDGEAFQVVISQLLKISTSQQPLQTYRKLRQKNPSPYMFYFKLDQEVLAGSSPETMVKLSQNKLYLKPIAGTAPRSEDQVQEQKNIVALLSDEKECAEHRMLVDLGRNDLGRVSKIGSVQISSGKEMIIEKFSHVIHIVSQLEGELQAGKDCFDIIKATFPAGTLTGAPKVRAMQIIKELEAIPRGFYGGACGYIGFDGEMDLCIIIRSFFWDQGIYLLQAGAGIVMNSVPENEYHETLNKLGAVLSCLITEEDRKC